MVLELTLVSSGQGIVIAGVIEQFSIRGRGFDNIIGFETVYV